MSTWIELVISNAMVATVMALLVGVVSRFIRRPHIVYGLWLLVLLKLVTPPIVPVHLPVAYDWRPVSSSAPMNTMDIPQALPIDARPNVSPTVVLSELPATESIEPITSQTALLAEQQPVQWSILWPVILISLYLFGTIAWFALVVSRTVRFVRLLRRAELADDVLQVESRRLAAKFGLRNAPRVLIADSRIPPLLWSLGMRPAILLPVSLLAQLTDTQQVAVLAHEMAHLRRRDHWMRWLDTPILGLFWWHPVAWWARRRLQHAEEQCCDAWVLWAFPERAKDYAKALLKVVEFLSEIRPAMSPVACGLHQTSPLLRRFEMILREQTSHRPSWRTRAALVILAIVLLPLSPLAFGSKADDVAATSENAPSEDIVAEEERPSVEQKIVDTIPTDSPSRPKRTTHKKNTFESEVLAHVNGEPITIGEVERFLYDKSFDMALQKCINLKLLATECKASGIEITEADLDDQIERLARRYGFTPEQWCKLLEKERDITKVRYRNEIIWPMVAVRKLAGSELKVTDKEVRDFYSKQYGPKIDARAIVCKNEKKARWLYDEVLAAPESFGELAKKESEDPASACNQGRLPPFPNSSNGRIKEIEIAVAKLKDGQISPVINLGDCFVIVKREATLAAKDITYEKVAPQLKQVIAQQKSNKAHARLLHKLRKKAHIERESNARWVNRGGIMVMINPRSDEKPSNTQPAADYEQGPAALVLGAGSDDKSEALLQAKHRLLEAEKQRREIRRRLARDKSDIKALEWLMHQQNESATKESQDKTKTTAIKYHEAWVAVEKECEAIQKAYVKNTVTLNVLLEAQRRLAERELAYRIADRTSEAEEDLSSVRLAVLVKGRQRALKTWKLVQQRRKQGKASVVEEAQAKEQFMLFANQIAKTAVESNPHEDSTK